MSTFYAPGLVDLRPLAGNNDVTYGFFLEADGTLAFTSRSNGGEFRNVVSQSTIPTNAWSHVTVAFKGSMLEFYVNGIVDARLPYSFTRPSTNGPMTIGSAIVDGISSTISGTIGILNPLSPWPCFDALTFPLGRRSL